MSCATYMQRPLRSELGFSIPGSRVKNGCELLCGCWELSLGVLCKSSPGSAAPSH